MTVRLVICLVLFCASVRISQTRSTSSVMIGLGELPPELVIQIIEELDKLYERKFDHFSSLRSHFLLQLLYLNRNWYQAAQQYLCYSVISLKDLKVSQLLRFYENDIPETLSTRHLHLRLPNPPWKTAEKACCILRKCNLLNSLVLEGIDVDEQFVFPGNLHSLTLMKSTVSDKQILELNNLSLYELKLEDIYLPKSLMLDRFSSLQTLSLRNSSISSLLCLESLSNLRHLDISGTSIDATSFERLSKHCPMLQSLGLADLRWSKRFADELADGLLLFHSLYSLDIINNTCGFSALLLMECLTYTNLHLGSNVYLSETLCRLLFSNLSDLEHLEFSQSCFISDINLNTIVKRCPKLSTLILPIPASLPSLHLISPFSLMRLPTMLPSLKRFEARGCALTYDVVCAFAKHSRTLEILIFDRFINTSPVVNLECITLLLSNCDRLIHLSVVGIGLDLSKLQARFYRTKISWK